MICDCIINHSFSQKIPVNNDIILVSFVITLLLLSIAISCRDVSHCSIALCFQTYTHKTEVESHAIQGIMSPVHMF